MANIIDYIEWRGDLSIQADSLNDIDLLILSRAVYAPFDGIVPNAFGKQIPLKEAVNRLFDIGAGFSIKDDPTLLGHMAASERFGNILLTGYINLFSAANQEQFAAITFITSRGDIIAAFRGTDGTLVGWKEDFNMAHMGEVPAQRDAVRYLSALSRALPGRIWLTGHSKGGNLAMYAHAMADNEVRKRIIATRNFDGPGFSDSLSERAGALDNRVLTYIPQASVVGMLLGHTEKCQVIKSEQASIYQHNVYNWQVEKTELIPAPRTTGMSRYLDSTLKNWLMTMPEDVRERMINGIYQLMAASGATTIKELLDGRNLPAYIIALRGMDPETREMMGKAIKMLKDAAIDSLESGLSLNALADKIDPAGKL